MEQIIATVTNWPVIIQGALGSALFTLLFFLGKVISKRTFFVIEMFSNHQEESKQSLYKIRLRAIKSETPEKKSMWLHLLIYKILGNVVRAFIWLIFGSISSSIIPVFGIIGYLGALYYLFNTLTAYKDITSDVTDEET